MPITFGILTVSDRCFDGTKPDLSGNALQELTKLHFPDSKILFASIVHDFKPAIQIILARWCADKCNVILTTGGTGFSPRDVTPEATKMVIEREAPGISAAILYHSLKVTPMAMLSRGVSGIRDSTLIVNLPGSVKAATECFICIKDVLQHAVDLLNNRISNVESQHVLIQNDSVLQNYGSIQSTTSPSNPIIEAEEANKEFSKSAVQMNCAAKRSRVSPYPMVEVAKAHKLIFESLEGSKIEEIDIEHCLHRVLAEDVYATDPLPPFDASIKDGYAVLTSDGVGPRKVVDVIGAGDKVLLVNPLQPGECCRISTGAPIPIGADSVVQVEYTDLLKTSEDGTNELIIWIKVAPTVGQDIRLIGSDIQKDSLVLKSGEVILPAHIGALATVGKAKVKVYSRLSIGVVSTGNELQDPTQKLKAGCIRDSNKLTLINVLKQYNYSAHDCGIARDDPNDVKRVMNAALEKYDVIITTGGVSMGEYDVVKQVLIQDFNATIHFGRINMKPGKPTTFATCKYKSTTKYIFALPGNPVSASVTTILFVVPALRRNESGPDNLKTLTVVLDETYKLDIRPEYVRAVLESSSDGLLRASLTGNQISSRLSSFVGAQVLLKLPGRSNDLLEIKKGSKVEAMKIDPYC